MGFLGDGFLDVFSVGWCLFLFFLAENPQICQGKEDGERFWVGLAFLGGRGAEKKTAKVEGSVFVVFWGLEFGGGGGKQ